jgi:hypothetical protein
MAALNGEWRKSTRSNGSGSCVKVRVIGGLIEVGDTKQDGQPNQPVLSFTPAEWEAFQVGVRAGEFNA